MQSCVKEELSRFILGRSLDAPVDFFSSGTFMI